MAQPKISVIVPIYNVEKYLDDCMHSLLNQTLRDIEIIMVDDESPDNCPKMCDEYAKRDSRIKVIHKKNAGLGFARNSGLDIATGEFVAFIDSDDFIDLNMFEHLYQIAKEYHADEVRCGVKFYVGGKFSERHDVNKLTVFSGKEAVTDFMLDVVGPLPECKRDVKYMMSSCCCIHSRKVIEDYHVRFLSERECLSEDLIWDVDLFPKMNSIVYVPECHYAYRMNPTSITHQYSREKYKRNYKFFEILESKLSEKLPLEKYELHLLRLQFLYFRNAISGFVKNDNKVLENVKLVLADPFWIRFFVKYPLKRLPLKQRIYCIFAKMKSPYLMVLLSKLKKSR